MRRSISSLLFSAFLTAASLQAQPLAVPRTAEQARTFANYDAEQPTPECARIVRKAVLLDKNIAIGEPLVYSFRLQNINTMGRPMEYESEFAAGKDLKLLVYPPRGRPYEYSLGDSNSSVFFKTKLLLTPQQTVEKIIHFAYDPLSNTGSLFDIAGEYRLVLIQRCEEPAPSTNPPTDQIINQSVINVTLPEEGTPDNIALNILSQDPENFIPIHYLITVDPQQIAMLQSVVDQAPGAEVYPFALFALANSYYYDIEKNGDASKVLAYKYFNQFLDEYPNHYLAINAHKQRINLLVSENMEEEALQEFMRLYTNPLWSTRLLDGDPTVMQYLGKKETYTPFDWMVLDQIEGQVTSIEEIEELEEKRKEEEKAKREEFEKYQRPPASEIGIVFWENLNV